MIAVEDMSSFEAQVKLNENDSGTWSKYVTGKLYENINLSDETYICSKNDETTSLQSGWYFQSLPVYACKIFGGNNAYFIF